MEDTYNTRNLFGMCAIIPTHMEVDLHMREHSPHDKWHVKCAEGHSICPAHAHTWVARLCTQQHPHQGSPTPHLRQSVNAQAQSAKHTPSLQLTQTNAQQPSTQHAGPIRGPTSYSQRVLLGSTHTHAPTGDLQPDWPSFFLKSFLDSTSTFFTRFS